MAQAVVALAKTVTDEQVKALAAAVRSSCRLNTLDHGLSNARSEATNVHLRVLTRRAYGFHTPDALIAMATTPLPGRTG